MPLDSGELDAYCYMVQRGKPAALVPVKGRYLEEALAVITARYGLKSYAEELANGWCMLWIYKYPHILEVIKATPQAPKTVFDHWVLGKLFGYEEAAIEDFLKTKRA
jgi:hypothetical protein